MDIDFAFICDYAEVAGKIYAVGIGIDTLLEASSWSFTSLGRKQPAPMRSEDSSQEQSREREGLTQVSKALPKTVGGRPEALAHKPLQPLYMAPRLGASATEPSCFKPLKHGDPHLP